MIRYHETSKNMEIRPNLRLRKIEAKVRTRGPSIQHLRPNIEPIYHLSGGGASFSPQRMKRHALLADMLSPRLSQFPMA
jgi:hypothetical protein